MLKFDAPPFFPPALPPGGTIGVVSPSRWAVPDMLAKSKALLEKQGYRVVVPEQNYLKHGRLAGDDVARAKAIADMFADPSIHAIICARGGSGAIRILDLLDYKLIKKNPKIFIGFSDITLLLQAITKKCGFVTYYGPMMNSLIGDSAEESLNDLLAVLSKGMKVDVRRFSGVQSVRPGNAEGRLVGGSIPLLQSLIGTKYDWSAKDGILFIEDVDEYLYRLDRMLQHMRLAGKFDGVQAVIVGEMVGVGDDDVPYGHSLQQILLDNLPPDVPLCMNFPCGHGKYLTTLPVGAHVKLALGTRGAELRFV